MCILKKGEYTSGSVSAQAAKKELYASLRRRSHPSAVSMRPLGRRILIGSKGFEGLIEDFFFWDEDVFERLVGFLAGAAFFLGAAAFFTVFVVRAVVFLAGAVFFLGAAFFFTVFVVRAVVFLAGAVFFLGAVFFFTVFVVRAVVFLAGAAFFLGAVFFLAVFVVRVVVFLAGAVFFLDVAFFFAVVFFRPKSFFKIIALREVVFLPSQERINKLLIRCNRIQIIFLYGGFF